MLPQSLHIFRKDLRHLWPETLVSVILLVAFAWSAPYKSSPGPYAILATLLNPLLHVLIPVAWMVLISRLIHDEPLVGDRQFWTSRPYHWAKLLLAKCLFLIAFIYLPFLLMQVYLLKHAGLHPTTALPDLLHNLLLLTVILVLPITALAAVTTTFAKVLLSALSAIIYILILGGVALYFTFDRQLPPHINFIAAAILILLPAFALVYQYARRRTQHARLVLLLTPIVALIFFFILPATALIHAGYPAMGTNAGPRLTPFPVPEHPVTGNLRLLPRGQVEIGLPFRVEGVDRETDYSIDGVALTIDAPHLHWTSPYLKNLIDPGQINMSPGVGVGTAIPLDLFNRISQAPADVHLSLAVEHLKAATSTWNSAPSGFDVPGHGHCVVSTDDPGAPPVCNFPFKTPKFLSVSAPVSADCSNPAAQTFPARQVLGGAGGSLYFDPVVPVPLAPNTGTDRFQGHLCPGTPLTFVEGVSVGRARLEVDDKQIVLNPLAARVQPAAPVHAAPLPNDQQ